MTERIDLIERYIAIGNEFGSLMTDILYEGTEVDHVFASFGSQHFDYCVHRANSIFTLIRQGLLWDAEIIARPFIECTVRLCFVSYAPKDSRPDLLTEYYKHLYEINCLEQSERAKKSSLIQQAVDSAGGADRPGDII